MSAEWQEYVNDTRTICKYGTNCYQKNPEHHKTYKHPPKKNRNRNNRFKPYSRERKQIDKEANESTNQATCGVIEVNEDKVSPSSVIENEGPLEANNSSNITNVIEVNKDEVSASCVPENEDQHETSDKNDLITIENLSYYNKDTDHKVLKELFLVDMPQDFFKFYECLVNEDQSVEKTLGSVNLQLIGPYDLLMGKLPILENKELYLIHWRFFYDPPEFQAVIKTKGKSEFHMGYFRDTPDEKPVFIANNDSSKDCHIKPLADNIFGAVYLYLQNLKNHSPFTAMACKKLSSKVKKWAEENNFSLEEYDIKKRWSETVTKTFHTAGIVVPYDKKSQIGYRNLVETNANIKKLFTKLEAAKSQSEKDKILSELQPIITYANIAVDESDFGTGLELGINLFCSGLKELHPSALNCLRAVYSLLNREAFCKIIQAHLKYRRKGPDMSVLNLTNCI